MIKRQFGRGKAVKADEQNIAQIYTTTNLKDLLIDGQKTGITSSGYLYPDPVNLNTVILRSLENAQYNDFILVIAKDTSSISDLLYYWNRLLYEGDNAYYITLEQLELLVQDKYFGNVIYYSANIEYSFNCYNCTFCFACLGLRKKNYCILNKQYTKEEYQKLKREEK
jgi:hypothetical protein